MADNTNITPGSGVIVASDELTINAVAAQVQRTKTVVGPDGTYVGDVSGRNVDGASNASAMYVDSRPKVVRLSVTPTISTTPAYTAKDAVGGLLTFANAARASGGSCLLQSALIVDKSNTYIAGSLDLVLFDRSITAPTDNAIFAPTDAEMANCLGLVSFVTYNNFSVNTVSVQNALSLEMLLNGTDLFGVLVARTTPTYTSTTDLVVILTIIQD